MGLHTLPLVGHPQAAQKLWRGARRETSLSAVEEPRLQGVGGTALLRNRQMFLLTAFAPVVCDAPAAVRRSRQTCVPRSPVRRVTCHWTCRPRGSALVHAWGLGPGPRGAEPRTLAMETVQGPAPDTGGVPTGGHRVQSGAGLGATEM